VTVRVEDERGIVAREESIPPALQESLVIEITVVKIGDEVPSHFPERSVQVAGHPQPHVIPTIPHSMVASGEGSANSFGSIRRTVIADEELEVSERLVEDRLDRGGKKFGPAIGGQDDADAHDFGRALRCRKL
jgi:hypothetical protein